MNNQKVSDFISDLQLTSEAHFEILNAVRALFHSANKLLDEDIKYGGLGFFIDTVLVAGIYPYKNHVSIEFSEGAEFSDPSNILAGKGKHRRHLKLVQLSDIAEQNASFFIQQAVGKTAE